MNATLYRVLIKGVPRPALRWTRWAGFEPDPALQARLMGVLCRERVQGGAMALRDARGRTAVAAFGLARLKDRTPATPDTYFRAASISKFVTTVGTLRLAAAGAVDLDADISTPLGFSVRHPGAGDRRITLRQLLSHRAGFRDSVAYQHALTHPTPLSDLLAQDVYTGHLPDEGFEYSNLGAGMVGAVLEAATGRPFDELMTEAVFAPAGVSATFRPQRVRGVLADAWRVLPPSKAPNYDAEARRAQPVPPMDAQQDYLIAHGGLCVTAQGLLDIAALSMQDPDCAPMRTPLSAFGRRDRYLEEGLGCFIYRDPALGMPLFGHQGLAYGGVHGLFFREAPGDGLQGFALLTSAASEQREGVITALNRDVAREVFGWRP